MKTQVCTRCVMDNLSDNTISFEKDGTCNYCNYSLGRMPGAYFPNESGKEKLDNMIRILKKEGRNKKYGFIGWS